MRNVVTDGEGTKMTSTEWQRVTAQSGLGIFQKGQWIFTYEKTCGWGGCGESEDMLKFSESSDIISINGKKKKEIKLGDCKMIKRRVFKH